MAPSMLDLSDSGLAARGHSPSLGHDDDADAAAGGHGGGKSRTLLSHLSATHSPMGIDHHSDVGGLGMMTDSSSGAPVDGSGGNGSSGMLMQSNSPLLLSGNAPLIGDLMPSMSLSGDLGSGLGDGAAGLAPLENKVAAATLVHNQIADLEAQRAKLEADLAEQLRAKQMQMPAAGEGAAAAKASRNNRDNKKRTRPTAASQAAAKARWAKKYAAEAAAAAGEGAPATTSAAAPAGTAPPTATAAAGGIQSHSSERRNAALAAQQQSAVQTPAPTSQSQSANALPQPMKDSITAATSTHCASLLPGYVLSCTDESVLRSLLDTLSGTFTAAHRCSFLPRFLKLEKVR